MRYEAQGVAGCASAQVACCKLQVAALAPRRSSLDPPPSSLFLRRRPELRRAKLPQFPLVSRLSSLDARPASSLVPRPLSLFLRRRPELRRAKLLQFPLVSRLSSLDSRRSTRRLRPSSFVDARASQSEAATVSPRLSSLVSRLSSLDPPPSPLFLRRRPSFAERSCYSFPSSLVSLPS